METIKQLPDQQPEINELVRIYAKEKGISEAAAWSILTRTWIPKAQIFDTYGLPGSGSNNNSYGQSQPNIAAELLAGKQNTSIQRLELEYRLKQLEYRDKTEAREEQKIELEKERIKNDKEVALAKLQLEKETAAQRIEQENKRLQSEKETAAQRIEQENKRLQSKEDFDAKLLLIQAGKKPEDAVEKFYERLFNEKKENDQSLEKLRKEHSDQLQKLENSIKNKSSPEDVFEQLEKLKKVEKGMMETTLTSLEAYGVDTKALRKVAKMEEKTQEGGIYEVGKKIWNDLVKPNIDKAQRELSPPPQQQQYSPTPEQAEQQREYQRRIAAEQERIKTEVIRKQEDNAKLQAQLDQERQIHDQRQQLEDRAIQLGIAINPTMTDRQISDLIIRQEFIYEQGRAQRDKLVAHAISIGITPDPSLTNEQLFDIIEHRESEIEQHRKSEIEQYEKMKKEQETRWQQEEKPIPAVQPVIMSGVEMPTQTEQQADLKEKRLAVDTIAKGLGLEPQVDEELIKPPEVSKETEEFLSGREGQAAEHRDTVVQVAESIKEVADVPHEPEPESQDTAPKKKSGKRKDKQEKQPNTYQVVRDDGEPVGDVEAKNPHGAAMKAARIIGAAEDAPVIIKISGGGLDKEQSYEVAMTSTEGRGGKQIQIAKAKRVFTEATYHEK